MFYDPTTAVSLNITNKVQSNPIVLTVDQSAPTASLAITGIDIEIIRYQSGRVIADNGTVTIQTGDTVAPENWVFGTTGSITFPDNSVQTTAYAPKYKVYTAILTQSGTASPTASVLENTLGFTPVWNRNSPGLYFLSSTGGFPLLKTVVFFCKNHWANNNYDFYVDNEDTTSNDIYIATNQSSTGADDLILRTPIEIRVYN